MRIDEIIDTKPTLPYGLDYLKPYAFKPLDVNVGGENFAHVLTIASVADEITKKSYTVVEDDSLLTMMVLPFDTNRPNDPRVVRVRFLTGLNKHVNRFDRKNKQVLSDETILVSDIPGLINFSAMTADEFKDRFNRERLDYENGIVGYLYLDDPKMFIKNEESSGREDGEEQNTKAREKSSKIEQAIEIFKSNPNTPRKKLIQQLASELGLSENGASSYYSHAKRYVKQHHYF